MSEQPPTQKPEKLFDYDFFDKLQFAIINNQHMALAKCKTCRVPIITSGRSGQEVNDDIREHYFWHLGRPNPYGATPE